MASKSGRATESFEIRLEWSNSTPYTTCERDGAETDRWTYVFNLYPSTFNEHLIELLSKYVGLPKENLQYFGSSDLLHEYICKVFISVGDPVLILGPSYDNFRLTCQANGANVYWSNYTDDLSLIKRILSLTLER